jgi:hypothetical protein
LTIDPKTDVDKNFRRIGTAKDPEYSAKDVIFVVGTAGSMADIYFVHLFLPLRIR